MAFNSNEMQELKHIAADRYQRNGGGGSHKVHLTCAAYDKSRGYHLMGDWQQAIYRAKAEFRARCELEAASFAYAGTAFDLRKEEKREATRYALATIPF